MLRPWICAQTGGEELLKKYYPGIMALRPFQAAIDFEFGDLWEFWESATNRQQWARHSFAGLQDGKAREPGAEPAADDGAAREGEDMATLALFGTSRNDAVVLRVPANPTHLAAVEFSPFSQDPEGSPVALGKGGGSCSFDRAGRLTDPSTVPYKDQFQGLLRGLRGGGVESVGEAGLLLYCYS